SPICCVEDRTQFPLPAAFDADGSGRRGGLLLGPFGANDPVDRAQVLRFDGAPTVANVNTAIDWASTPLTYDTLPVAFFNTSNNLPNLTGIGVDLNGDGITDYVTDQLQGGAPPPRKFPYVVMSTGAGPRAPVVGAAPMIRPTFYGVTKSSAGMRVVDMNLD